VRASAGEYSDIRRPDPVHRPIRTPHRRMARPKKRVAARGVCVLASSFGGRHNRDRDDDHAIRSRPRHARGDDPHEDDDDDASTICRRAREQGTRVDRVVNGWIDGWMDGWMDG
jgi:hypothetical protein